MKLATEAHHHRVAEAGKLQLERALGIRLPERVATRKKRLATIQAAMKRLEERQMAADQEAGRESGDDKPGSGKKGQPFKRPMGEPKPKAQDNFTDRSTSFRESICYAPGCADPISMAPMGRLMN